MNTPHTVDGVFILYKCLVLDRSHAGGSRNTQNTAKYLPNEMTLYPKKNLKITLHRSDSRASRYSQLTVINTKQRIILCLLDRALS